MGEHLIKTKSIAYLGGRGVSDYLFAPGLLSHTNSFYVLSEWWLHDLFVGLFRLEGCKVLLPCFVIKQANIEVNSSCLRMFSNSNMVVQNKNPRMDLSNPQDVSTKSARAGLNGFPGVC